MSNPLQSLYDVLDSGRAIQGWCAGRAFADYVADRQFRRAVEREFEIIGEALAQPAKRDPDMAARISEYQRVIAFRNVLIHGYAEVDDRLVWDLSQTRLPKLRQQVDELLQKA